MGKKKYLAKNIGILTLSQLGTRFISFFLVPLYTSILTTTEYGTYDLVFNTISIMMPVLTLNVSEAVIRFSIDENADRPHVFTVGVRYVLISNIATVFFVLINHIFYCIPFIDKYAVYVVLMFAGQSVQGLVTAFVRGVDRFKDISVSSVLGSLTIVIFNILFLTVFRMGLDGYFIANILGPTVQVIYLVVHVRLWSYVKSYRNDRTYRNEMLSYSKPLIANSVGWWINAISDRYIVTIFCGLAQNGVYSVASKIPAIMNMMVSIFNQAWTLSSTKEFDSNDKDGFFSGMYNTYNALMVLLCTVLIACNQMLSSVLYAKEFYTAWRYVPFLLIATVFGAISGYMGGVFSAIKDSKIIAKTTVIGAAFNFAMNMILVPALGAMGAAIATLISYWITYLVRLRKLRECISMKMYIARDNLSYILLTIQGVLLISGLFEYNLIQLVFVLIQIILYKNQIYIIFQKIGSIIKRK